MSIKNNLRLIKQNIPDNVTLVAVSKTKTSANILEAYNSGHKIFGENKVQELEKKHKELPPDIEWHMIGNLQKNKVKYIAPFISLIHSIDSIKLIQEVNKRAIQNNRTIKCLLQVHIAKEETKFGFKTHEIEEILIKAKEFKNIKITGLMAMATFTDDIKQINKEFKAINNIYKNIKNHNIHILSTGMSNDYKIAINNGSNMIRVGSAIFGKRN